MIGPSEARKGKSPSFSPISPDKGCKEGSSLTEGKCRPQEVPTKRDSRISYRFQPEWVESVHAVSLLSNTC